MLQSGLVVEDMWRAVKQVEWFGVQSRRETDVLEVDQTEAGEAL
jgi:hypothetical protein